MNHFFFFFFFGKLPPFNSDDISFQYRNSLWPTKRIYGNGKCHRQPTQPTTHGKLNIKHIVRWKWRHIFFPFRFIVVTFLSFFCRYSLNLINGHTSCYACADVLATQTLLCSISMEAHTRHRHIHSLRQLIIISASSRLDNLFCLLFHSVRRRWRLCGG